MKRFFLFFFLFLSCALILISCAKNKNKKKIFGATYMTMNNPFFVALNNGIKEVIEARGDKLITLDPSLDQTKQIAQVEDMISQGVAAIFLNPVDWKGVKPALDAAKRVGIPIINVDTSVYDDGLVDVIVASDNYNAGILIAQDVLKRLKNKKKVNIVLLDHPTAKSAVDRIQGFFDVIKDNPKFKIVARQSSEGQLEQAMPVMESIIQSHSEIDVVMSLNDPTAIGAMAALQAAKKDKGVLIYGVDGAPIAKRAIKEGKMTATAAQSPIGIGKTAADIAYKILAGQKVKKEVLVSVVLIDKENIDKYEINGWQ